MSPIMTNEQRAVEEAIGLSESGAVLKNCQDVTVTLLYDVCYKYLSQSAITNTDQRRPMQKSSPKRFAFNKGADGG